MRLRTALLMQMCCQVPFLYYNDINHPLALYYILVQVVIAAIFIYHKEKESS